MNLTLYKYLGERNKVDKSNDLVFVMTATGSFKADVNILSPTLILSLPVEGFEYLTDENQNEIDDVVLTDGEAGNVLDFNYMYIAEFRRYYYVTSIVVSSNELVMVTGEVDPLYSFKDQIVENYGMVERNEFEYNEMLTDDLLPLKNEHLIYEYTPISGSRVNVTFNTNLDYRNDYSVALTNISAYLDLGTTIYPPSNTNLPTINSKNYRPAYQSYAVTPWKFSNICDSLEAQDRSTWFDGIVSAVAYPFVLNVVSDNLEEIVFGYDEHGNLRYLDRQRDDYKGKAMSSMLEYLVVADFTLLNATDFTDLEPYASYELYIPFVGWITLDFSLFHGHGLLVYYAVNVVDGSATCYVYDEDDNKVIYSSTCQIGVKLSISRTNQQEITAQKNANALNLAVAWLGSTISIGAGLATSNPLMIAGGAMGIVSSTAQAINKDAMLFKHSRTTFGDPATALYAPMQVKVRINKVQVVDGLDMAGYAHQFGRPLRLVKKLKDLSGFTKLSSVHLEGVTATDIEKTSIESSLLAGVIL